MIDATDLRGSPDHPLQKAARAVKQIIPPDCGFIIIASPWADSPSDRIGEYVSNVDRESAIAILKTVLFRWGINGEWMKNVK